MFLQICEVILGKLLSYYEVILNKIWKKFCENFNGLYVNFVKVYVNFYEIYD